MSSPPSSPILKGKELEDWRVKDRAEALERIKAERAAEKAKKAFFAGKVTWPLHKICNVDWDDLQGGKFLLAATGPCIQTLSKHDGALQSLWPRDDPGEASGEEGESGERPSKRVKLDRDASELSEASIEIVADGKERQKGERRRPKIPNTTQPHVSHLITTSDGRHAVAVTAEDKSVRVLEIRKWGKLKQLSIRQMPKKCCAVILSEDEKTILTADKFGDVYAIPLHLDPNYVPTKKEAPDEKPYEPSASELTVHTKGNLDALKQQQMQKQKQPRKEGPDFEHKLLLGHVSLLTDLKIATGIVDGEPRPFILTADRDEHIRVSRGIPQSHVIHTFCFGATEFITKLCIVPWAPQVLVAGNGEPSLRVYDWQNGEEKSRFDFMEDKSLYNLGRSIPTLLKENFRPKDKISVSGIWPIPLKTHDGKDTGALLVTFEGLNILTFMKVTDFSVEVWHCIELAGNVLDITIPDPTGAFFMTLDTQHEPSSCRDMRETPLTQPIEPLRVRIWEDGSLNLVLPRQSCIVWKVEPILVELQKRQEWPEKDKDGEKKKDGTTSKVDTQYSALGEFMYGLENLRRRRERPKGGIEAGIIYDSDE